MAYAARRAAETGRRMIAGRAAWRREATRTARVRHWTACRARRVCASPDCARAFPKAGQTSKMRGWKPRRTRCRTGRTSRTATSWRIRRRTRQRKKSAWMRRRRSWWPMRDRMRRWRRRCRQGSRGRRRTTAGVHAGQRREAAKGWDGRGWPRWWRTSPEGAGERGGEAAEREKASHERYARPSSRAISAGMGNHRRCSKSLDRGGSCTGGRSVAASSRIRRASSR